MKKCNKYRRALVGVYSMLGVYDGGTICVNSGDAPTSGYAVSVKTLGTFENLKDIDITPLISSFKSVGQAIPELCAGSFKDPKTGNYMIEASKVVKDIATAAHIAKELSQDYIFDLSNSKLISVQALTK